MSELIRVKSDLIEYLTVKQIASKSPPSFAYVSTVVRKIILTDENQGKFIHKGCSKSFEFESIGGGVYKASIVK